MMKSIFTKYTVLLFLLFNTAGALNAQVTNSVSIPKLCLGETETISGVADSGTKHNRKLRFWKGGYLNTDWSLGLVKLDSEVSILMGWSTKTDHSHLSKIFGVLTEVRAEPRRDNYDYATIKYQPVLSDCRDERKTILDLLIEDKSWGANKWHYTW